MHKQIQLATRMTAIYKFPRSLSCATIHARPSTINKSPYLVDIELQDGTIAQAHNPALGCGGYVVVGATVYVMSSPPESRGLSKYILLLVELTDNTLVCINPQVGNKIAEQLILQNYIHTNIATISQEVTREHSRFDFGGTLETGEQFYVEVKSAPIADIVDCMPGQRAKCLKELQENPPLFTIFPYGNNRKAGVISPRALKHAEHLTQLQQQGQADTTLLYLSMRPDVDHFQISELDTQYNEAIKNALDAGVKLISFALRFSESGDVYIEKQLDIYI